jgi:hypothetical protein
MFDNEMNFRDSSPESSAGLPESPAAIHYQQTAACPPLPRLIDGRLSAHEKEHSEHCTYCRKVSRFAQRPVAVEKPRYAQAWWGNSGSFAARLLQLAGAMAAITALFMISAHDAVLKEHLRSVDSRFAQSAQMNAALAATIQSAVDTWTADGEELGKDLRRLEVLSTVQRQHDEQARTEVDRRLAELRDAVRQNVTMEANVETKLVALVGLIGRGEDASITQQQRALTQIAALRDSFERDRKADDERLRLYQAAYYDTRAELDWLPAAGCTVVTKGAASSSQKNAGRERPQSDPLRMSRNACPPESRGGARQEWMGLLSFDQTHGNNMSIRFVTADGQPLSLNLPKRGGTQGEPATPVKVVGKIEDGAIHPERITILAPPEAHLSGSSDRSALPSEKRN